jgi:hypothetical protein
VRRRAKPDQQLKQLLVNLADTIQDETTVTIKDGTKRAQKMLDGIARTAGGRALIEAARRKLSAARSTD